MIHRFFLLWVSFGFFVGGAVASSFDYEKALSEVVFPFVTPSLPPAGKVFADPVFGTPLVRVTDVRDGRFGPRVRGLTNEYSRYDPVNADGSLLLVRGLNASWHLYDRKRYRYLGPILGKRRGDFSPRWHATDPDRLFFIRGTVFYEYLVSRGAERPVFDFKKLYPKASFVKNGKGESSLDSRYWAFMVVQYDNKKSAGKRRSLLDIVVFDAEKGRVVSSLRSREKMGGSRIPRTVTVSMSGRYVLVEYIPEIVRYRLDWSDKRVLPGKFGHGDLARGKEGQDLFVGQDNATDYIVAVDLDSLERTLAMKIPFRSPLLGGVSYRGFHVSGNAAETPGWVLISTYGKAKHPTYWSDGALFLLELEHHGRHLRIAHTRSRMASGKRKDYWAEAFATIDRRGKWVYWGSNWGRVGEDYLDVYQATLPENWFRILGDEKQ